MEMFSYAISPIDFDWVLAPKVSSLAERLKGAADSLNLEVDYEKFFESSDAVSDISSISSVYTQYHNALRCAKEAGWEGDHREPPRYFVIPAETDFYIGFIFKQDNSGVTFVISPISLPHLDPISF